MFFLKFPNSRMVAQTYMIFNKKRHLLHSISCAICYADEVSSHLC